MYLLVANSFLSAFLIFQIQPIVGKMLLPIFGGGASIWSATMMSFQLLLLAGYVYAYVLSKRISPRWQRTVHTTFLLLALFVLLLLAVTSESPIYPSSSLAASFRGMPVLAIVLLIACSVGLPYFVLASNSTLMQVWLAREGVSNPYWMYAFSNAGSSLALLSYPFLIEPFLGVRMQGWVWSCTFLCFIVLSLFIFSRFKSTGEEVIRTENKVSSIPIPMILLWVALSFLPSMMLLAVTAHTTQEVAPVPFLWIVPLFLYLLSFIVAFSSERAYSRFSARNFLFVFCTLYIVPGLSLTTHISLDIIIVTALFFLIAWFCHGELYRIRPDTDSMQLFYVYVALGGVLGGLSVSVLAPLVLDRNMEFYIGLLLTWGLYAVLSYRSAESFTVFMKSAVCNRSVFSYLIVAGVLSFIFYRNVLFDPGFYERNFYGSKHVFQEKTRGLAQYVYKLKHGTILHGKQGVGSELRKEPVSYYGRITGAGRAVTQLMSLKPSINVGIIGLGVGTFAAYGRKNDHYTFFEIDPAVQEIAEGKYGTFSYLQDSRAKLEILLGDARVTLRELPAERKFDLLVVDAFSSDAIPVHLLTLEAVRLYRERLRKSGIIAIHISNRHLNLLPVCFNIAHAIGIPAVLVSNPMDTMYQVDHSIWVLLAEDKQQLQVIGKKAKDSKMMPDDFKTDERFLWTDDFSNLYSTLFEPQDY